jgi:hypothetical protein
LQNTVPSVLHPIAPLHLAPEAHEYMTAKVQGDLPALVNRPESAGTTEAAAPRVRYTEAGGGRRTRAPRAKERGGHVQRDVPHLVAVRQCGPCQQVSPSVELPGQLS